MSDSTEMADSENQIDNRDCKHGHLARSCYICELEAERGQLKARVERLEKALAEIASEYDCHLRIAKEALQVEAKQDQAADLK